MVGLQAEVGIAGDTASINLPALLEKLKEPLHPEEQPKPPIQLLNSVGSATYTDNGYQTQLKPYSPNWSDYKQYLIDQQKKNAPSKLKRSNFADRLDRSSFKKQSDQISSEEMKTLLDWIHEENRKDLLMQ